MERLLKAAVGKRLGGGAAVTKPSQPPSKLKGCSLGLGKEILHGEGAV